MVCTEEELQPMVTEAVRTPEIIQASVGRRCELARGVQMCNGGCLELTTLVVPCARNLVSSHKLVG